MKFVALIRSIRVRPTIPEITGPLQYRTFQPDFVTRDPNTKPKSYKYPPFYDPCGPKPPPSDKIIQLAEQIAALAPEERKQIGPTLRNRLMHPKMQPISVESMDVGPQGGPTSGSAKAEKKGEEKTAFDVKLEKFDAAAKIKVIKEVRAFTNLGLKEAKDLVEKVPVLIKQGVTKEEANSIIEKIKASGGCDGVRFKNLFLICPSSSIRFFHCWKEPNESLPQWIAIIDKVAYYFNACFE